MDINRRKPYTLPSERRTVEKDLVNGHRVRIAPLNLADDQRVNVLRITKLQRNYDDVDDGSMTYCYYTGVLGFIEGSDRAPMEPKHATEWEMRVAMQRLSTLPFDQLTQTSITTLATQFNKFLAVNNHVVYELVVAVFFVSVSEIGRCVKVKGHILDAGPTFNDMRNCLFVAINLLCTLTHLKPIMIDDHRKQLCVVVTALAGMSPPGCDGVTALHDLCRRDLTRSYPFTETTVLNAVEMLLDVGADPEAVDDHRNSPLHFVAVTTPVKCEVIELLLRRGAHFDGRNAYGHRFTDYLQPEVSCRYRPSDHIHLKCLTANAIVQHDIPSESILPPMLEQFVNMH